MVATRNYGSFSNKMRLLAQEGIEMKNIIVFLRHVVTPLIFCLFLVLGLTAAMLSGVIEYSVIKELFASSDANGYSFYTPLIIVIVLEGLKLFLHYAVPAHGRIGDTGIHIRIKSITKYVLVLFSLLCTVIYVSNSLYTPEAVKSSTETMIEQIELEYQTKLDNSIKGIENETIAYIENEKDKVESVRLELNQLTPVYRPRIAYDNYIKEKQRLETKLDEAEKEYELAYEDIMSQKEAKILQAKETNSIDMQKEIDAVFEDFNYVSSGDNSYLSSALTFMVSVLGYDEYNRTSYYLCVLGIALIVSLVLELAISFAQFYLSLNEDKLKALFDENGTIDESLKKRANLIVKFVVQASVMLSIYLIYQAFAETIMTSKGIISAFASYLISIILTSGRFKLSLNVGKENTNNSKVHKTIVKAKNFALPMIVQTLICIVGFLLLSVYMGYTLSDLIPTTIALSVGSISGQVILQPKSL